MAASVTLGGIKLWERRAEEDGVCALKTIMNTGRVYSKNVDDEHKIDKTIASLTEKRTRTRVAALEKLTTHLLNCLAPEDVSDSFINNVLECLRKPSEEEAVLGSRILAIMAIIFGSNEERFFHRSKHVLRPLIRNARNAKVKSSTIHALGLIGFLCIVENENTEDLMKLFETFFNLSVHSSICKAALESWGLIASSLTDEMLASESFLERIVPQILALLDHKDVDVRSSAGENLALLHESAENCSVSLPCGEDIVVQILEMSKDGNKRSSKKDRKTQHIVFRDIHSTLANSETPHVSFLVRGKMLDIRSWKSVKQFEAVKGCLQTGLQDHITYNNALRAMLGLPETFEDHKIDRRDLFNKNSAMKKQRNNELKGDRKRKQHMQDTFYDIY
ncbi:putative armadillo-like helical protein [Plasmopara halstedii]